MCIVITSAVLLCLAYLLLRSKHERYSNLKYTIQKYFNSSDQLDFFTLPHLITQVITSKYTFSPCPNLPDLSHHCNINLQCLKISKYFSKFLQS